MLTKINQSAQTIKSFLDEIQHALSEELVRLIENQLEKDVSAWLYRAYHQRRHKVKRVSQALCQRCGSSQAQDFSRNGHRKRQLVSQLGVLTVWLPRVVCQCGGSVHIPFSILKPYQQIWDDVLLQIGRWADLGVTLRQMQTEIGEQYHTQVGLRTLNQHVHSVETGTRTQLTSVPPIVMLDAIWVTLLTDTQNQQQDSLSRCRTVKSRTQVCVLVALGLYPQTGHWGILDWHIANSEAQSEWEALLLPLEQRGMYRQRGLELFIHDGGKGLIAALNYLYPTVPHQRCSFHKLRNLWHSIQAPEHLDVAQRRTIKHDVLRETLAIFDAPSLAEAETIQQLLIAKYQHTQPAFVATLKRDWHETVAFFRVLRRFPDWQRTALRTTSLLERVNRMMRTLFRPKGAFHSHHGLQACIVRVLDPHRLI